MPEIILYKQDGACSLTPHMLLRELEIPFAALHRRVNENRTRRLRSGRWKSFTRGVCEKSPNGYIPALSVDVSCITEAPAILRYIASFAPERNLMGSNLMESIRVEEWLVWLSGTLHVSGFGALWRPGRFVDDTKGMYPIIVAKGQKVILRCYDRIESRIEGNFAAGEHLTVVDFYLHTFWRWGAMIGADMSQYPKFTGVAREVEKLESVQAAMAGEHQPLNFADSK